MQCYLLAAIPWSAACGLPSRACRRFTRQWLFYMFWLLLSISFRWELAIISLDNNLSHRYRVESLYAPESGLRAVAGHRRILTCLEKKDDTGIEAAVRDHLKQSKRDMGRFAFGVKPLRIFLERAMNG
jgi:hypothetical protein